MLYSMTGYGKCILNGGDFTVVAETKSVNSRFLDISIKIPQIFSEYEYKIRSIVPQYISRGKVNIHVELVNLDKSKLWNISLNEAMIDAYADIIEQIDSRLTPEHTVISLERFLFLEELFVKIPNQKTIRFVGNLIIEAVTEALKQLKKVRRAEGRNLQQDIQKRLGKIKTMLREIKKYHDSAQPRRFENLREEVKKLVADLDIDPLRLSQEVALIAAKADCTEEIVRLESHIGKLEEAIKSRKPVGSLLNFILQECYRETNTIGAKTDVKEISDLVINLKEEFERIKEQVQNIE